MSIRGDPCIKDAGALVRQLYQEKCHSVDVLTMRSTTVDWQESQARKPAPVRIILTRL